MVAVMSRGLGKIERVVLGYVAGNRYGETIDGLAGQLVHDDWLARNGKACQHTQECCDVPGWEGSRSDYETVRRAVSSLRRKGLITARWEIYDGNDGLARPVPYLVLLPVQKTAG